MGESISAHAKVSHVVFPQKEEKNVCVANCLVNLWQLGRTRQAPGSCLPAQPCHATPSRPFCQPSQAFLNQRSFSVRQLLSGRIRLQQPRRRSCCFSCRAAAYTGAAARLFKRHFFSAPSGTFGCCCGDIGSCWSCCLAPSMFSSVRSNSSYALFHRTALRGSKAPWAWSGVATLCHACVQYIQYGKDGRWNDKNGG